MTRGCWLELVLALDPELGLPPVELGEDDPPEEQAARAVARSAAALAARTLLLEILLSVNFDLSSQVLRFRRGLSGVAIFVKELRFCG
jgi:hypothetical protein